MDKTLYATWDFSIFTNFSFELHEKEENVRDGAIDITLEIQDCRGKQATTSGNPRHRLLIWSCILQRPDCHLKKCPYGQGMRRMATTYDWLLWTTLISALDYT
jgi:hypothetical protein